MPRMLLFILAIAATCLIAVPARGQCAARWIPGKGIPGVNGTALAVAALPNGDIVVGGAFSAAGPLRVSNVAKWSAAQQAWMRIGPGFNNLITSLLPLPNGDLIAAGSFTEVGGLSMPGIARWSEGTRAWSPIAGGLLGGQVNAVALLPNGDLVAVGQFTMAGGTLGVPVLGAARYVATNNVWVSMGAGINRGLNAVAALPNGDAVVGGTFGPGGPLNALGIGYWHAATNLWSGLGTGLAGGEVAALVSLPNGDLIVGGSFSSAGGLPAMGLARWNMGSATWSTIGPGVNGVSGSAGVVNALALSTSGDLLIGGAFAAVAVATPVAAANLARWSPTTNTVSSFGTGPGGPVTSIAPIPLPGGEIVVAGGFASAGGIAANNAARWTPSTGADGSWSPLGGGVNGTIDAIAVRPVGDAIVGGLFADIEGVPGTTNIARYDAASDTWTALGFGLNGRVRAIAVLPGGDVIAGGEFSIAPGRGGSGNIAVSRVARYNFSSAAWSPLGGPPGSAGGISPALGQVNAIAVLAGGDIVIGGAFTGVAGSAGGSLLASNIARYSPTTGQWSAFGSGADVTVHALLALPSGDLVAGGIFSRVAGIPAASIARWSAPGGTWSAVGQGVDGAVYALALLPSGEVAVGGEFATAGGLAASRIASVNLSTRLWTPLGAGGGGLDFQVNALAVSADGGLYAGGGFTSADGVITQRVGRWDLATRTWSGLGGGVDGGDARALGVLPIAGTSLGDVCVGGTFLIAGNSVSPAFAIWTTRPACPADYNCSGDLAPIDIFHFLDLWFAHDPHADFNRDQSISAQDIFDYLAAWFAGC